MKSKLSLTVLFILLIKNLIIAQKQTAKADTGIASYYAIKFDGRKTASGEIFRNDSLTAAHKTLPFGTKVKVTNLKNKRSVMVTINDRGMKGKNRIIDLSQAAAAEIRMLGSGLVKVKIEVIEK
jgi:rare lipoprotein A